MTQKNPQAIITIGPSYSGKTTWAENHIKENPSFVNINRDDIRFPDGNRDYYNYKFSSKKEKKVTEKCDELIMLAAQGGRDIIISDTNLNAGRRETLKDKLIILGYSVTYMYFDEPLQELYRRDKQRYGGVGESVILRQWLQQNGSAYTQEDGIKAYIVDLDGTMCINTSRGWYEWDRVGEDKPNVPVVNMVKALDKAGYCIVFMSGRDSSCRAQTEEWLAEHYGREYELFMRSEGDMRRDSVVKEELFHECVEHTYKVEAVIDDRKQVIQECWMKLGIPVIGVGRFYEDF